MNLLPGDRMLASLPAVFRDGDAGGDLAQLLGVFEQLFFGPLEQSGPVETGAAALPGIERQLQALPALFVPMADDDTARTPDAFLPWLADWLAFTPHALFTPAALRRIVAGIVPLYAMRGSRSYLLKLLQLCFEEIRHVEIDDRPRVGLVVGSAVVGRSTRLATTRPFWFTVVIETHDAPKGEHVQGAMGTFEDRLRAVIDFAKPAHTDYDLQLRVAHARAAA